MGGTGFYLNTLLSSEATAPSSTAGDKHYVEQLIANKTWDQGYDILSLQLDRNCRMGKFEMEFLFIADFDENVSHLYIKYCLIL